MMRRIPLPLLLPFLGPLAILAPSCGGGEGEGAATSPEPLSDEDRGEDDVQSRIDELRAMGYAGYADADVDPEAEPVTIFDRERSAKGYNLISNRNLTTAQLLDPFGGIVREWKDEDSGHWSNVELTEDGELLIPGTESSEGDELREHYLMKLSWEGDVVWRVPVAAHHDVEVTPAGRVACLTFIFRPIPEVHPEYDVRDNGIAVLTQDGELVEEYSIYGMLAAGPDVFSFQHVERIEKAKKRFFDLLHSNSVEFLRHEHLVGKDPIYAPQNVLVSIRHQDTIAIFDTEARKVVWAWGQGEISGPHDATMLANGNVLLYDSGLGRDWTRVVELDPLTRTIVWEYRAPEPADFYSESMGSNQRLPNGNTLIASSNDGEAFEVTPEGEIVWHFTNFNAGKKGKRATIVRIRRYPLDFVHPLLER